MSNFQEYTEYYATPEVKDGQITIIGRHYYAENQWLPVPLVTDEDRRKSAERNAYLDVRHDSTKYKTAEDLDRECSEVAYKNEQLSEYGRV